MPQTAERFTKQVIRQTAADGSVKERVLAVPNEVATLMHRAVLRLLYSLDIPMPHATGAMPGKRLLDNVKPHQGNDHFYMVDLKNAFPSVDIPALKVTAAKPVIPARHQAEVQDFITNWATTPLVPGLPLGAPASPYLFNLSCLPLDRTLGSFCQQRGITYTRYLDDLTFSSRDKIGKNNRRHLRSMIEASPGAEINHAKSRLHHLANGPVTITGVSLYPDRHVSAPPALLEKASQTFRGIGDRALNGEFVFEDEIGQLHGYFGAVEQVSDDQAMVTHRLFREYRAALGGLGIAGGGTK
ncbi:hypothetical protein BH09PAT3_BH09PAT3_4570 [soil metagenome]